MAVIKIQDPSGKLTHTLHNRKERREYEKARGVKLHKAGAGPFVRPRGRVLPARHVTSRTPAGGSGPSELAEARQTV